MRDDPERLSVRWVRDDRLVTATMDGEVLMLDANAGRYYGLDPIGAEIWGHLSSPMTVADLVERLETQYDVETDRCTRDVARLIDALAARKMIKRVEA